MTPHTEELLNLYIDGELPLDQQGDLFAHLAACRPCRLQFNALMSFRLATRLDALPVPPVVDEALFQRVHAVRQSRQRLTRAEDRRPFHALSRRVTVGTALAVALAAFVLSLVLASPTPAEAETPAEAVYILWPGLTVEEAALP